MRALRYFYLIYFAGVLVFTGMTLVRLFSKRPSVMGNYFKDFCLGLAWPLLPFGASGRFFMKQLFKG